MKTLKVVFYNNPRRTKHHCPVRTEGVDKITKKELKQAIELLQTCLQHYDN